MNLKDAYRQLGYDTAIKPRMNTGIYSVLVTKPQAGVTWTGMSMNPLPTAVLLIILTPDWKKAVINYLPVSFGVEQWYEYDRLYVYLLPDKLSSFMRLTGSDGKYSEKLDELMQYKLVCIATKMNRHIFIHGWRSAKRLFQYCIDANRKNELDKKLNSAGPLHRLQL